MKIKTYILGVAGLVILGFGASAVALDNAAEMQIRENISRNGPVYLSVSDPQSAIPENLMAQLQ